LLQPQRLHQIHKKIVLNTHGTISSQYCKINISYTTRKRHLYCVRTLLRYGA